MMLSSCSLWNYTEGGGRDKWGCRRACHNQQKSEFKWAHGGSIFKLDIQTRGGYQKDVVTMITFKRGPVPADNDNEKLYKLGKKQLQVLYEEKYEHRLPPEPEDYLWTEEKEAELETLEHGNIEDIINDTALSAAIDRDNELLATRLYSINDDRRRAVLIDFLGQLNQDERERLINDVASTGIK